MARNYANNGRIYRAVVTWDLYDGRTHTATFGPYDTPGAARGQLSRVLNRRRCRGSDTADGWIETSEVVWVREAD